VTNEAALLSRLLFQARERDSMFIDIVEGRTDKIDVAGRKLRDEIDAYRAEHGWSPHGFGGEQPMPFRVPEDRHPGTRHFEKLFAFEDLPQGLLQDTSARFAQLAQQLVDSLPDGPELTACLRKLIEAKDCFMRAAP
jgi:hypothetical protein